MTRRASVGPSVAVTARVLGHLRPGAPAPGPAPDAPVATQTVLSTVGVLVQGLVRFVFSVTVGNVLGKAALGAANSAISLALFSSLLFPSAAAQTATKFIARARGKGAYREAQAIAAYLAGWSVAASVLLGVLGALAAPFLLDIGTAQAAMTGALVVAYSGYMLIRGILFGSGLVRRATFWDVLSSLAAVLSLALVIAFRWDALILAPLVLCYGLYVLANLPSRSGGSVPPELRREMRGFLGLSLTNSLAVGGLLQLSMVGAQYWDPRDAGLFAAALTLATPASLVSRSISLVLLPSLSTAYGRGDHDSVRHQTDVSTRALSLLSLATFGPLMLVSPMLIALLFPSGFDGAEVLLPILLAAVMLSNVGIGATNTLLTREQRHARIVVLASVSGAVVALVWWFVLAPSGGVYAIAVGYLVATLVVAAVPFTAAWRLDRQRWSGLMTRFLLGSLAAGLLVWWEQQQHAGPLQQALLAGAFGVAWVAVSRHDLRLTVRAARRQSS